MLTADTLFHGSKLPLLYWFMIIHLLTSTKKTFSALEFQRQLGHMHYQPISPARTPINRNQINRPNKRGVDRQRKAKVFVLIESERDCSYKGNTQKQKVRLYQKVNCARSKSGYDLSRSNQT